MFWDILFLSDQNKKMQRTRFTSTKFDLVHTCCISTWSKSHTLVLNWFCFKALLSRSTLCTLIAPNVSSWDVSTHNDFVHVLYLKASEKIGCHLGIQSLIFLWLIYGHYVFWSVCLSVRSSVRPFVHPSIRLSVPLQVRVFGQGSFWWSWSPIYLKHSTHVPYDMIFLILMPN